MASASEKYHVLIELAPDPIFLINLTDGTIVEVNERAAELLGYDRDTLEGKDVTDVHPPDDEAYRALFEQMLEDDELRTAELPDGSQIQLRTRAGRDVPVELHGRVVDVDGERMVYTIARDITHQHEHEHELERQNEHLAKFADIVSHDLRNPLNVAKGRVTLAREECESDHLDVVVDALDRMETLIDDTLTLARQGQTITDTETVRLAELVSQCWEMVDTSSARLEVAVTPETAVVADRERLQQALENLIHNAVEHGSTGGRPDADGAGDADGTVTVRVGTTTSGVFVEDDGPGVPEGERERVFDAGYTTGETGTGFGLAIVAKIAAAHGWDVSVTESASGGARFELTGMTFAES